MSTFEKELGASLAEVGLTKKDAAAHVKGMRVHANKLHDLAVKLPSKGNDRNF